MSEDAAKGHREESEERYRDLTEREMRQAEERWRTIMENTPDFIALLEPDGTFAYINRTTPGLRAEDLIGRPVVDFVAEHDRERVREAFRRVFEDGVPQSYETEGVGPHGQTATYQTRLVPLRTGMTIACALAISTDITPMRQASLEIARHALALEQAQELHRIKANFVNAVTHELRTPLASIFGYLEFLQDRIGGDLTPQQETFLTEISVGARRLARLVDDLLDFARLEAGTFTLHPQRTDLRSQLQSAVASLMPQARARQIRLEAAPMPDPLPACLDPQRLQQILGNLLSNALKFTPEGGRVWIEATAEADALRIGVHDTGVGIAAAELPRLFQRFSQLEAGLRSGTGAGLGLSITKALVEAHGGTIGVASTPGEGSHFWVSLPRAKPGQACPAADVS